MATFHAPLHRWFHRAVPYALLGAIGTLGVASLPAHAALGGDAATVTQDRRALGGTAGVTATASVKQAVTTSTSTSASAASTTAVASGYRVETMTTDAGTTVNEYLTSTGVVFAIAWSGPQIPDLRQLLGSHFAAYASGNATQADATPGSRGPTRVSTDDLVVRSGGHMRGFEGAAYLKSQLPAGFNVDDIR